MKAILNLFRPREIPEVEYFRPEPGDEIRYLQPINNVEAEKYKRFCAIQLRRLYRSVRRAT